jgi:hypothetical protein
MHSETEEFITEIEISETPQRTPRSFALYEEYSHTKMAQIIRIRKDNYEKANSEMKRRLEKEAQQEINGFCQWLEQTQNMEHHRAYYYATSLKSILLGLPIGVQIAQLFGTILDQNPAEVH